jgi:hypothetical protein
MKRQAGHFGISLGIPHTHSRRRLKADKFLVIDPASVNLRTHLVEELVTPLFDPSGDTPERKSRRRDVEIDDLDPVSRGFPALQSTQIHKPTGSTLEGKIIFGVTTVGLAHGEKDGVTPSAASSGGNGERPLPIKSGLTKSTTPASLDKNSRQTWFSSAHLGPAMMMPRGAERPDLLMLAAILIVAG